MSRVGTWELAAQELDRPLRSEVSRTLWKAGPLAVGLGAVSWGTQDPLKDLDDDLSALGREVGQD